MRFKETGQFNLYKMNLSMVLSLSITSIFHKTVNDIFCGTPFSLLREYFQFQELFLPSISDRSESFKNRLLAWQFRDRLQIPL